MGTALVTGATAGIGKAIALALAQAGHRVTGVGRDIRALDELSQQGIAALPLDLTDAAAVDRALAGQDFDILVNNAGMMPPLGPFWDLDPGQMQQTVAVNLTAVLTVTRALTPGMVARGRGHVFFTGSVAGHAPYANIAVYCATKAAIGGFAQALRLDLAPHGVRVTEIVAGRVETGLYDTILPAEARAAMYADHSAVQPPDVAAMLLAVLDMPPHVDVARFDILPTRPVSPPGTITAQAVGGGSSGQGA